MYLEGTYLKCMRVCRVSVHACVYIFITVRSLDRSLHACRIGKRAGRQREDELSSWAVVALRSSLSAA